MLRSQFFTDQNAMPVLALLRSFSDDRFAYRGFDLVELQTGIRALVNCGGFPKAFSSSDLSTCGLLIDHAKAMSVRKLLRAGYPDEHHANCDVWAIWQTKVGSEFAGEQSLQDRLHLRCRSRLRQTRSIAPGPR